MDIDYFAPEEFEKCIPKCKKEQMDLKFLKRLNRARQIAGIPFVLNSAYRDVEHERLMGRSGRSMHCKGRAVDIRCTDSYSRYVIINACIRAGLYGLGIADTYIHIDDRDVKCMWLYSV